MKGLPNSPQSPRPVGETPGGCGRAGSEASQSWLDHGDKAQSSRESDRRQQRPPLQMSRMFQMPWVDVDATKSCKLSVGACVTSGKRPLELSSGREQMENLCGEPVKHD